MLWLAAAHNISAVWRNALSTCAEFRCYQLRDDKPAALSGYRLPCRHFGQNYGTSLAIIAFIQAVVLYPMDILLPQRTSAALIVSTLVISSTLWLYRVNCGHTECTVVIPSTVWRFEYTVVIQNTLWLY